MQREIGDEVKIEDFVTPFKSVRKSPDIDNTASNFDNANLKVKILIKNLSTSEFTMQT